MSELVTTLGPTIWFCDDIHSGAAEDASFGISNMPALAAIWRWLGQTAVNEHQEFPGFKQLLVAELGDPVGKPFLKAPDYFIRKWEKTGYGGMCVASYACDDPDYVAISDLYVRNYFSGLKLTDFPLLTCVRRDMLRLVPYKKIPVWTDRGSDAQDHISLWSLDDDRLTWSADDQPDSFMFKAISSYPPTRTAASQLQAGYSIDWNKVGYAERISDVPEK